MRHYQVISIACTLVTWDPAQFYQFSYILSYALPLKLGLIQSLTSLRGLRPDFGGNADWLLEQYRGIWLALEINGSWKSLFLAWLIALNNLREWSAVSGEKDCVFVCLFVCLFFLTVLRSWGRKICLNMCHGNSENSNSCPYRLRICFIYGTNVSVSRSWIPLQVVDPEQDAFWFINKRVQVKTLSPTWNWFHLKVSPGMTFLNGVRKRRLTAKETSNGFKTRRHSSCPKQANTIEGVVLNMYKVCIWGFFYLNRARVSIPQRFTYTQILVEFPPGSNQDHLSNGR